MPESEEGLEYGMKTSFSEPFSCDWHFIRDIRLMQVLSDSAYGN